MIDGPGKKDCSTLFKCFKWAVDYGLRYPNGVSDQMVHTLGTRYPVDVLYFLIVLVVLLNVVFGIIIDTFGNLRNTKIERILDTEEKCFMCGIHKQVFDRASSVPNGFRTHIKVDHNMWNYLYFIIYVWEQDKDDDDGLEQFVRQSLQTNDISWFPMNKALRMAVTGTADDDLRKHLTSDITTVEKSLVTSISSFQRVIAEGLEKVSRVLKKDKERADELLPSLANNTNTNGLGLENINSSIPITDGSGLGTARRRMSRQHSSGPVSRVNSAGVDRAPSMPMIGDEESIGEEDRKQKDQMEEERDALSDLDEDEIV
jgi:hypothetical protein